MTKSSKELWCLIYDVLISDVQKFHEVILKMRQGKEASVFNERTDDSSATQYFQVSLISISGV